MVKYKATHDFKGKKEKKKFEADKEYDFTVERAEEINATLEKTYKIKDALVRVHPPKKEKKSEPDADNE